MKRGTVTREPNQQIESPVNKQVRVFATMVQTRVSRLSLTSQKRLLVLCCLLALGISIGTSYYSLSYSPAIEIAPIQTIPLRRPVAIQPLLSLEEYRRIHAWRLHLDSLTGASTPRNHTTPPLGQWSLRDTLLYLEGVYHQQFK